MSSGGSWWARRALAALLAAAVLCGLRARLWGPPWGPQPPGARPGALSGALSGARLEPPEPPKYHHARGTAPPPPARTSSTGAPGPPQANVTSSPASSPRSQAPPGPPLAGQLYEAGHEWPHPELCPKLGAHIKVLILVTSAPSHSQARQAVRLTWGHFASRSDVALAFVIGSPAASLRQPLAAEDALYGDIVRGRFVDSYSNLTLKTLCMLEWADTYCPRARRLLKTDDDMFINVPLLLQFAAAPQRANATKTIWGKVVRKSPPWRVPASKYYLSPAVFPGRVLPEFCTGPAYLLTRDSVRPLLDAALTSVYLPLEDVFVTGVVGSLVHVSRRHSPQFYNKRVSPHACAVQRGLAIHMVRYHEQFDLWRKLLDGKTKCAN